MLLFLGLRPCPHVHRYFPQQSFSMFFFCFFFVFFLNYTAGEVSVVKLQEREREVARAQESRAR